MPAMSMPSVQYLKKNARFLGYALNLYYQYNEVWRLLKLKKNYVIIDGLIKDPITKQIIIDPVTKKPKYYEYVEAYNLLIGSLFNSFSPFPIDQGGGTPQ